MLPEPRPDTPAEEYARLARLYRLDGRRDLALSILDTARRLTRMDAGLFFELGQAYAEIDRVDRALEMYEAAIALDPEHRDAHWERGVLLERRGLIDETVEAWRRAEVTRDAYRHSRYLAAVLKSPRATNETLLEAHREWARHHAPATPRIAT